MILKQSVGIDISKDEFHVCFSVINTEQQLKIKGTRKFANTPKGFEALSVWMAKRHDEQVPLLLVMEATGTYYEQLAWYLHAQQLQVAVVLPNKAKRYLQAMGQNSKNDKIDARGLAQMGAQQRLKLWKPLSKKVYTLRLITREYESLQQERTAIMNQLHALSYGMFPAKSTERRLRSRLRQIDKLLATVKQEIVETVKKEPELSERVEKICRIKGVDTLTIAETDGFALIEKQGQLVSYAGYDTLENQSGKRAGKTRISKKGNAHIRRCLHMPAFNMVRYNVQPFQALYDRLMERGKTKMQAYVAIQKKLLVIIWTLWKKNEAFDPEYVGRMADQMN